MKKLTVTNMTPHTIYIMGHVINDAFTQGLGGQDIILPEYQVGEFSRMAKKYGLSISEKAADTKQKKAKEPKEKQKNTDDKDLNNDKDNDGAQE
ncbi:TPA: hypothetical protein ACX6RX_003213 [Photobacterium damselae]